MSRFTSDSVTPQLVSELEMRLCDALQAVPRATWADVGEQLELTAATTRRRWQALVDRGEAWITTYQGPQSGGILASIEIGCVPSGVDRVAAALGEIGQVMTITAVTGDRDLLLTVMTRDLAELRRVINLEIGVVDGITSVRSAPLTHMFRDGSEWRSGALDAPPPRRDRSIRRTGAPMSERTVRLLTALQADGRATVQELADTVGASEATVRRLLRRSLADGVIRQRVDVASASLGWPHAVTMWLVVPTRELADVAKRVSELSETRLCGTIAGGASNLIVVLWLRDIASTPDLEARVIGNSGATVSDRSLILHYYKRLGHRMGEDGRHIDSIASYST